MWISGKRGELRRRGGLAVAVAVGGALVAGSPTLAQDPLVSVFQNPPAEARPRVWWHWLDGDISQDGIDKDLAWMKRVGLGGAQHFDGAFGTPLLVSHRVVFMTPEWRADFAHAVDVASCDGLELSIASSPGWSESGGPWVAPERAMKKMVWSETRVQGGRAFTGVLAAPPATPGPFGDLPVAPSVGGPRAAPPSLYRDSAVVAFPAPRSERLPPADITASAPIDPRLLDDGDLVRGVHLPFGPGDGRSWVRFDFGRPQTVRALKLAAERAGGMFGFGDTGPHGRIEASNDGRAYRTLAELPDEPNSAPEQTIAFPAATARYFRVVFEARPPSPVIPGLPVAPKPVAHTIYEMVFEGGARVHRFEDKAGWSILGHLDAYPTPEPGPGQAIAPSGVVDLTGKLRPDGHLDWTPPPGEWTVLRIGWSLTGVTNHPASAAGTGLEVDKLNRADVHAYMDTYLSAYATASGGRLGPGGVASMVTDSYEAGPANWTDDFLAQFKARRGYDPTPFLPVLAGRVVGGAAQSDAFLWDFRKTLGDLIAEAHYAEISAALHAHGMRRYGEAHESGRAFIGDGMEVKKSADLPMGAMWASDPTFGPPKPTDYDADLMESASVAHLYGQNLVAAESFTAGGDFYAFTPQRLKPIADRMLVDGVNHFSIHTSVHQPVDDPGPGVGLGSVGQWFTRKETWADMAAPWVSYLARSSALLQQGRAVKDLLWFYGEDDNITDLYGDALPAVPKGYGYDFVNADALTHIVSVDAGELTVPSGARYRAIILAPRAREMSLPVLKRLSDLVARGAVLIGAKPEMDVSLADDPKTFRALADALWGGKTGRGRVIAHADLGAALREAGLESDLEVEGGAPSVDFAHRTLVAAEIYFLSNPSGQAVDATVGFRTRGAAEVWRADDGSIAPLASAERGGRSWARLHMAAHDAAFVVFRQNAQPQPVRAAPVRHVVTKMSGPWTVSFPPARGAPDRITLDRLLSLTESAEPGVKYFSGVATYRQTLDLPPSAQGANTRLILSLGDVAYVAQVRINGRPVGVAWKPPFEVDVTGALHPGANAVEIDVADLWPNRLIGDKQPGVQRHHAFATFDPFTATSPLPRSGLLGPVTLLEEAPVGR